MRVLCEVWLCYFSNFTMILVDILSLLITIIEICIEKIICYIDKCIEKYI